jgi:hypothetical protein
MGAQAIAAFERAGGLSLAVVGEMRGDTGSAELESRLFKGWALASPPLPLPAYGDTVAYLSLWRRKSGEGAPRDEEEEEEEEEEESQHVRVDITGSEGSQAIVTIRTLKGDRVGTAGTRSILAAAKSRPTPREDVVKAVGTLGDTPFLLDAKDVHVLLAEGLFVPLAEIKAARRDAVRTLSSASSTSSSSSISSMQASVPWTLVCAACGKAPSPAAPMLRDRLTRAVVACSADCSRHPVTLAALDTQLALRHLPPLRVWRDVGAGGGMLWKTASLL